MTTASMCELQHVHDKREVDDALSEPSEALCDFMAHWNGDLLILGAGGKMGPTFARMARRALDVAGADRRVFAVSRFSKPEAASSLEASGVTILRGDLFDQDFVATLPEASHLLYLVGMKFGTASAQAETWASNAYLAGVMADRFRSSRLVALSTGNVYGLSPISGKGSVESDPPAPLGEYAMSALGRERVLEHFSRRWGTSTALIRLNYATELRYGVLVDLARKVLHGESISLDMGYFNAIWQRDACDIILRSFAHASSPPLILNVTGAEHFSCRDVCERLGKLLERQPRFVGTESETALLSDASQAVRLFGRPATSLDAMLAMTSQWIRRGGETWNKPTHFEVRDGEF
jgi:nucleoside-diphosphate-sugar epimerase